MADFSFLSDSDDNSSAIEDIISQAKDLSVLEQISAINCSSFTTLPTDLDTRFRKLKSFPVANTKPHLHHHHHYSTQNLLFSPSKQQQDTIKCNSPEKVQTSNLSHSSYCSSFSPSKDTPDQKRDRKLKLKLKSRPVTSPANSSNSSNASSVFTYSKEKSGKRVSISSSPPAVKQGCFLCSPKSLLKKKKKDDEDYQEILSGLTKEQKRMVQKVVKEDLTKEQNLVIQKAIKEEEKISREVDKIVTWAKQASSRMIDFDLQGQQSEEDDDDDDDGDCDDSEYDAFK